MVEDSQHPSDDEPAEDTPRDDNTHNSDPLDELSLLLNQHPKADTAEEQSVADAKWEAKLTDVIRKLLKSGETVSLDELANEHPSLAKSIQNSIERALSVDEDGPDIEGLADDTVASSHRPSDRSSPTPGEQLSPADERTTDRNDSADDSLGEAPQVFGRYRVQSMLGSGGFGVVYRAWDEELERKVAIKVARRSRRSSTADEELAEARVLAKLDHPGIVPVYDVGRGENESLYVVSKYIRGKDLSRRQRERRLSFRESTKIVTLIAKALDYAHRQGVVHRDVKPGNILLSGEDTPILVDFGLAIHESDFGRGSRFVGTPAYMSPEQARREGHRVDGRSDIYSLGAVFYQLLTGRRPFNAASVPALLELIKSVEVRPPRQIDPKIPRELERICLKALSKRVSDRYNSAADLAEDLELWAQSDRSVVAPLSAPTGSTSQEPSVVSRSDQVAIIPRGLRAFDSSDADFFLKLLPGPMDREGLPESIRFWKTRIEETDAESSFRVGVLLGPSGSGKSSMVRAGIAPHLSENIVTVWADTRAPDMEKRLLRRIRKRLPSLEDAKTLHDALVQVRRSRGVAAGRKLLLVFDQFEQWLSFHSSVETTELADALRQCDGVQLQALLLIRDDFTLSAAEFLDSLEEPLSQTRNFATVDLFGVDHAHSVLQAYGRAFGAVSDPVPREQEKFMASVVEGLADNGRIIPIQLALFADMVKDRPWTMATLREYGGLKGIGVAFLEEKLEGPQAHPFLRSQVELVRSLLRSLLPEESQVIKGGAKTRSELIQLFSQVARPDTLDRVLGLLDSELRLITPAGGDVAASQESSSSVNREPAYQLTHDYLVPAIRSWLTAADRASREGRWRLRLGELSESWNAKPENRRLPTTLEWAWIRFWTNSGDWTAPQKKMMSTKGRQVLLGVTGIVAASVVIGWTSLFVLNGLQADSLRGNLLNANTNEVAQIVDKMQPHWARVEPMLSEDWAAQEQNDALDDRALHRRVNLALALSQTDDSKLLTITPEAPRLNPKELLAIRGFFQRLTPERRETVWAQLAKERDVERRLAIASLLAGGSHSNDEKWGAHGPRLIADLCSLRPFQLKEWVEHFEPIKNQLKDPLSNLVTQASAPARDRRNAVELISVYAADDPLRLADAIGHVETDQMEALLAPLKEHGREGATALRKAFQDASATADPPPPGAELVQWAKGNGGAAMSQGGYVLGLPLAEVPDAVAQIRKEPVHIVSLRTRFEDEHWVADLAWAPGASAFEIQTDLSKEKLHAAIAEQTKTGKHLQDLDVRISQTGEPTFSVVWRNNAIGDAPDVFVGHTLAEEIERHSNWDGHLLERFALWPEEGEFRCASVWIRDNQAAVDDSFIRSRLAATFGDLAPGYFQVDLREHPANKTPLRAALMSLVAKYGTSKTVKTRTLIAKSLIAMGQFEQALARIPEMEEKPQASRTPAVLRAEAFLGMGKMEEFDQQLERCRGLQVDDSTLGWLEFQKAVQLADVETAKTRMAAIREQAELEAADSVRVERIQRRAFGACQLRELVAAAQSGGECLDAEADELKSEVLDQLQWLLEKTRPSAMARTLEDRRLDSIRSESEFLNWASEAGFGARYESAWRQQPSRVSQAILGESSESHRRLAAGMDRNGYRLRLVDGATIADGRLQVSSLWERAAPTEQRHRLHQRLTNLAIALAHMGESDFLLEILQDSRGRSMRAVTVESLPTTNLPPELLVDVFRQRNSTPIRRGLLLALGEHAWSELSVEDQDYFNDRLESIAATTPDAGLRSAAIWCARRWNVPLAPHSPGGWDRVERGERAWYVNSALQTMVVLNGDAFLMGSPHHEPNRESHEFYHWRRINRKFAIADTETTVEQFQRFLKDKRVRRQYEVRPFLYTERIAPTEDCPQTSVRWYDAALFCQWLSEEEEIPATEWCYPDIWDTPRNEWKLPTDYLDRTGYRLPTEAEWEFACRAGGREARSYGGDDRLLGGYCWYALNSNDRTHEVGLLKPNDFGLFDMLGNVSEWCQETYVAYRPSSDGFLRIDEESSDVTIRASVHRVHRGGAYASQPRDLRSARRYRRVPGENSSITGFRVVRTVK